MKGLKALGYVVAFTPLLAGCQASPAETSSPFERSEDFSAGSVRRIIDGDTVVVVTGGSETTIRLIGVNAPERNECFFRESTDYLVETLEGATVEIETLGTDQFGRTLAYLWEGPSLVNLDLVAGGWAIATTPGEEDHYGKEILAAEKKALAAAAGLWATDACGSAAEIPKIGISAAPNPPGPDNERLADESITLTNEGPEPVDISGWVLRDESSINRYRFDENTIIQRGASIRIASTDSGWTPGDRPVWNNDGDMVMLLTAQGTVVAHLRYAD